MNRLIATVPATLALAFSMHAAWGQAFSSGSTGADGAFSPATNQTITVKPGGVYNYTTVNIPSNVTIRYQKGLDNAPVIILASGNVVIDGSIVVSGFQSAGPGADTPAPGGQGGPGGFDGGTGQHGAGFPPSAGKGPGGGAAATGTGGGGGVYGAPNQFVGLVPLFGGSGGGGGLISSGNGAGGGGGGGAILIASTTKITVNGSIRSNGGDHNGFNQACAAIGGPGSGGAIRLVAPEIAGSGSNSLLQAINGSWNPSCSAAPSNGLIRLEATTLTAFTGLTNPTPSIVNAPGPVSPAGSPALANVPTLAIASVGGVNVPATVSGSFSTPDIALAAGTPNPIPVVINATNTPVGAPTDIRIRLVPRGTASTVSVPAANHTGTFASSTATANVNLGVGQVTILQAYASMTLTGQFASLFPSIDGEPVERVALAANLGERSMLSLVTRSGKERRVDEMSAEDQLRVARAWDVIKSTRTE